MVRERKMKWGRRREEEEEEEEEEKIDGCIRSRNYFLGSIL